MPTQLVTANLEPAISKTYDPVVLLYFIFNILGPTDEGKGEKTLTHSLKN